MLTKTLEKTYIMAMLGLILVVFAREFVELDMLLQVEIVLLALVIVPCIILARGLPLYFSVLSLIIGHILYWQFNLDFATWFEGITKNLPLAILFVLVPLLSIPLRLGGYLNSFYYFLGKYSQNLSGLYTALTSLLFGLSSITNLGSLRILHTLVEELKFPSRFLAKIFVVGFTASIAWSPYFGSVNLALYYTGVSFNEYVVWGFLYGFSLFVIGNVLFLRDKELQNQISSEMGNIKNYPGDMNKLKHLGLVLIGLFLAVIIGERFFTFNNMMLLVSMIAVIYGILWSGLIKKIREFIRELGNYPATILQVKNEVVFFLSVGFFGVVAANTPLQGLIEGFFQSIATFNTFFIVTIIIGSTMLLSLLGIHMVVTLTILGLSLNPEIIGLHPIAFALTITSAWVAAIVICPFAPFNIITAGLVNSDTITICFRWNKFLALAIAFFSGIYISIVNFILY